MPSRPNKSHRPARHQPTRTAVSEGPDCAGRAIEENLDQILEEWLHRVSQEVNAAHDQPKPALQDSMAEYIRKLADLLKTPPGPERDRAYDVRKSHNPGFMTPRVHGMQRASLRDFKVENVVTEYALMRRVITHLLSERMQISEEDRETIAIVIENSMTEATAAFSKEMHIAQQQYTAKLAHDLRNPLSAVKIATDRMLYRPGDEGAVRKASERVKRAVDRVDGMIETMLDASRLEDSRLFNLDFAPADINDLCRATVDDLREMYRRPIDFTACEAGDGNWSEDAVVRILENLISNAFKYGDEAAPVCVELNSEDQWVDICVTNHGEGIAKERQAELFQQYKQSKVGRKSTGWGIGLAVVQALAQAHNGWVRLESEQNVTTSFTVRLVSA